MSNKTKIVMVSPNPPWFRGGVEKVVGEFIKHLKHFEIEVFCTGDEIGTHIYEGTPVHVFKGYSSAYHLSPNLYKALKKSDFDLIHAHGFTTFMPLAATRVKKDKPFVFSPYFHEYGSTWGYSVLRKLYDPLFGKYIFNKADKIICISNIEKKSVRTNFNVEEKISIIPPGVDLAKIRHVKPFEFNHHLILYVGRLEKYKNIHVAIKAMEFLPECYFYIIGDAGGYKKDLEQLIKSLNLEDRVKILSNVSDAEKYRWMKTCSLFVNLSSIEAFGITVLEALAAGKPVIVNEEGGLRELADKFDGVFPVRVHEFKERDSIEKLAKIMRESMGKEVKTDLDEYDWDIIAKKVEEVYSEVYKR